MKRGDLLAFLLAALATAPLALGEDAPAAELYETKCMACHMPEGKALLKDMSLADNEWKHGSKVADIVKVIRDGVEGTPMLPFKELLSKTEIEALARYVRAFDKTLKPEDGKGKK
jgi:cytochrome c oxidase cbb3-type subunit 3